MIAISYRREDSLPVAGRLYDRLQARFGKQNVFMDFDSIPPGVDFREQIKQTIERSTLVLAVIGPRWLGEQTDGSRRIDDLADFVRLEIKYALEKGIPIIPLLIDNTLMPKPAKLPSEIEALAFRNALPLDSGIDFHTHAERLINGICGLVDIASFRGGRPMDPSGTISREDPTGDVPSAGKKTQTRFIVYSLVAAAFVVLALLTMWLVTRQREQVTANGERLSPVNAKLGSPSPKPREETVDHARGTTVLLPTPASTIPSALSVSPLTVTQDRRPQHGAPDRTELSPRGDIIVEYWKGEEPAIWLVSSNPENKEQCRLPYETFDSILFSPDQNWIIVGAGTLYQRTRPEGVLYTIAKDLSRQKLHVQTWQFYMQQTALSQDAKCDPTRIEIMAWEPDSSGFIVRVACFAWGVNAAVPAPYFCKYDVIKRRFLALTDASIRQAAVKPWVAANVKPNMNLPRFGYPLTHNEKRPGYIDEFARQFVMMNQVNDSGVLLPFYDSTVEYFDHGPQGHDFIRDDIEKYNERWPLRLNNITRPTRITNRGPNRYDANYTVTYYAESRVRREWTSGQISTDLSIFVQKRVPRITSIKQTRISSEKGSLNPAQSTPAAVLKPQSLKPEKPFSGKWSGVLHLQRTGPGGLHDTQTWDTILEISADETKITLRTSLGAPTYRVIDRKGRTLKWEEPGNGGSSPHSFTVGEDGKTGNYEGTSRPDIGCVNRGTGTFRRIL